MKNNKSGEDIHKEEELDTDNMSTNDNNVSDNMSDEKEDITSENETQKKEENWEEKYNQLNDSYLRLNAEFDNFRKRTLKERGDLLKTASEKAILDMIPIIDDFERAIENLAKTENGENLLEGVKLIYSKFLTTLSKHNVKEMKVIGELFDVDKHEALTTIPATKEEDKDKIVDCIQKGYSMGDKIIRFPKVIVAK